MATQQQQKQIPIRMPYELWRRLQLLKINGKITSIQATTLAALEKAVDKIERDIDE